MQDEKGAINMKEDENEKKLAEGKLGERIDDYLQGKIDSSVFPILVILDCIFQWNISDTFRSSLNIVIGLLIQKGPLTTKEEQELSNALKEGMKTFNRTDGSVEERCEAMWPMTERMVEIIQGARKQR